MIVGTWFVYNPPPAWPRVSRYPLAYCDQCGSRILKRPGSLTLLWKQKHHFCSLKCSQMANRKGGCIRLSTEQKLLEKHGVTNVMQIPEVKKKYESTVEERYGSTSMMGTKHFMEEREKTWIEKYGVDHNFKLPGVQEKAREARFANGNSFPSSKSEDRFYEFLCSIFGSENVERQVRVHIWPIDFYVKSIDAHIQFDGVYWHGLDRSLAEIKKFRTETDRVIYKKWLTDHQQNDFFRINQMKLFRVSDKQFEIFRLELERIFNGFARQNSPSD